MPGQCQWRCQGSASGGARAVPVAVPGQCQWRCQGSASGGARAVPVAVPRAVPVAVPGQSVPVAVPTLLRFPPSSPTVLGRQSDVLSPSHHYKFHMLDVSSRIQQPASSYIPHEHMSVVESIFK